MSGDTVFRTPQAPASKGSESSNKVGPASTVSTAAVEVPYLDYEKEHGKPYTVEHFVLGDTWKDPTGGFPEEIGIIEDYFKDKIASGDIANSVTAVKDRLKEILKVTNMSKEERSVIKLETIAAYIKFLSESDDIKHNIKRYGNTQPTRKSK